MPCYSPAKAFKLANGGICFSELKRNGDIIGDIKLPCGQCVGCRLDRSREWSVRCLHEAKMHAENSFITLTYDDKNLPADGSLNYEHYQKFIRALRKKLNLPVRFFMCGEYGETTKRAHYHAIVFGYRPPDLVFYKNNGNGDKTYTSDSLAAIWARGFVVVGDVTRQSAGYVARYCLKKLTGDHGKAEYGDREPPFARMSLKPGIGARFFEKYMSDILPNDYVISDGFKIPVPKYYDKLYEKQGGDLESIKWEREKFAKTVADNNTPERLAVREEVQQAKLRQLRRSEL